MDSSHFSSLQYPQILEHFLAHSKVFVECENDQQFTLPCPYKWVSKTSELCDSAIPVTSLSLTLLLSISAVTMNHQPSTLLLSPPTVSAYYSNF